MSNIPLSSLPEIELRLERNRVRGAGVLAANPQLAKTNENNPHPQKLPHSQPQRNEEAALERTAPRGQEGQDRARVRFELYRVRCLDPDNAAGSVKALLDGCRYAGLIQGDEPWRIILEVEQFKVGSFKEEKTVIVIDDGCSGLF
jgi:hypothetical protein